MKTCELCGGPLHHSSKYGVCKRNPTCRTENKRRQDANRTWSDDDGRDEQVARTRRHGIAMMDTQGLWNVAMNIPHRFHECRVDGSKKEYQQTVELLEEVLMELRGRTQPE